MNNKPITKSRILELLKTGKWELGWSDSIRSDGRFWMQKGGLRKGGELLNAHAGSVRSLEKQGLVISLPKAEGDPFWLRRYKLNTSKKGEGDE